VVNNGGDVTYTPALGFSGTDTFTYTATDGADPSNVATVTVTVNAPAALDLDIAQFRVTKNVRVGGKKLVDIKLVVKNNSTVNSGATRPANLIGVQGGVVIYNCQTGLVCPAPLQVSDPVGDGRSRFEFPSYTPTATGDINWTVMIIDDNDPDDDTATAVTSVR
ncbi:MAG: cadherin-like domain-containing protein, partial [Gammaproteobacteria bacterium]|nr:cadherin-like domain-containing protein [Gammaproteobacteria bacterium]